MDLLQEIRKRWKVLLSAEQLRRQAWLDFLTGYAEAVLGGAQQALDQRIDEVNTRIKDWNREHPEEGNKLTEVKDEEIADLLGGMDRSTISKWRRLLDCGVKVVDFVKLLYVFDVQLSEAVARPLPGDLEWAGYERAMREVLLRFDANSIPELTPRVCQDLRAGNFEGLGRALTDAYAVALEAYYWGNSQLNCVRELGPDPPGPGL